jgi:enoyl-CoA hydratase/carnithine racemase
MSEGLIISRPTAGVVVIQIDNPPYNALGTDVRARFTAELDALAADLDVRAIVLTGAGKTFCAGDDLREAAQRGQGALASLNQFGRLLSQVEQFRVPVIAAVNGHAVGGGLELALACDIRIGSSDARFIGAGVNVGLMASVYRLPRLVGVARAKSMLLTGLPVDAGTALSWGLLTALVEPAHLAEEALKVAARIASRAPLSVEATKRQTAQAFDFTAEEAAIAAGKELSVLSASRDHQIGIRAFVDRKDPVFTRS